jgi:hypothetical protein
VEARYVVVVSVDWLRLIHQAIEIEVREREARVNESTYIDFGDDGVICVRSAQRG